jgi:hypothetical protein
LSWVKAQVIAGHRVAIGILDVGGSDPQYDHIVTVVKIGTDHAPNDPSYYPGDVLYFDDHGAFTLKRNGNGGWAFSNNPGIPPGAGSDTKGCTPYIYAYRFGSFVKTRLQENARSAPAYAIVMPDANGVVRTITGNTAADGDGHATVSGPHNVAFAITGPLDPEAETMPVTLAITGSQSPVNGKMVANPFDANSSPAAGYNYENPYIGNRSAPCEDGKCVSNAKPAAMTMRLQATVNSLTPGIAYNLYEYDFSVQTGAYTGNGAALAIPTDNFNAQSGKASFATRFVAQSNSFTAQTVVRSSDAIVVFRAVPASAP